MREKEIEDANKKSSYIAATINLILGSLIMWQSYQYPYKDTWYGGLLALITFILGICLIGFSQAEFRNAAMMRRIMKK